MKDIFELGGTIGTADVLGLTPKMISATIEEIRRGKRVFAQFYKSNNDLIGGGGTAMEFPAKNSGVVVSTNMGQGSIIDPGSFSFSNTTINSAKHGVGIAFYGEALRSVKRDIIKDGIAECGDAYADAMDTIAIEAMFPSVTYSQASAGTIWAATFPIGFKSVTGTPTSIIWNSSSFGLVAAGGLTVSAWYVPSTAGARTMSAGSNSFSAKDVLMCQAAIQSYNFNPDVLVVHPNRMAELFYDPSANFLSAYAYRNAGPLWNGEIGQMWGMKVIVTNKAPMYGVALIDSTSLGYEVNRKELALERDQYTGMKADILYFWGFAERNYGVVNARAYGAVFPQGTLTSVTTQPTR